MNPKLATLAEGYADRPAVDREWANYATADAEGVYRLYILTVGRVEWFVNQEWDRFQITVTDW